MKNPLLEDFEHPPFDRIEAGHYEPAILKCIEEARREIDAIENNTEPPSFENTLEALDYSGDRLARVSSIFFNLNSAETSPEMQKIAQKVAPVLSEFSNDISLNARLFERIRAVYENPPEELSPEQRRLLDQRYKSFRRNGALLGEEQKARLRSIDSRLSSLSLTFGERVLAESNAYTLHVTDPDRLAGLPDSLLEAAAQRAREDAREGWVFTLDFPMYIPFMKYAADRDLREELSRAFGRKGFQGNENDNREIITEMVNLRRERAQLLGYPNHAAYVLENRMADEPAKVLDFLEKLRQAALPVGRREFAELSEFARKDGIDQLQPWDSAYYQERLKKLRFDLDDEVLKPYFELNRVISGVFDIAGRLFGLTFRPVDRIPVYHEEVLTYEVTDQTGRFLALFYADFHPRPGKRQGAWMTSYRSQYRRADVEQRPQVSIVCNFTRPTESKPALLTFNEVTTLFHEFGHALHGMLADTRYPGLSGTSVYWDFVELPSQLMENWCYEKEALATFARHYETDEPIPMEYIDRIRESSKFMEGMATLRQIGFALLDMQWHTLEEAAKPDVQEFEDRAMESVRLFPKRPDTCMSTSFSHIFQGGYSSGYYSYKWAEVLDADAFSLFVEKGIFDPATARSFREHILSKGGSEDPSVLYRRFRGRDPEIDSLLERAGLQEADETRR